jgi:hypothetical protein
VTNLSARPRLARRAWIVATLVLALVQGALLATTAWDKADTFDEPFYLGVSAILWIHRDFSANRSAALPKWVFGATMGLTGAGIERVPPTRQEAIEAVAWARSGPEFRRLLFPVRFTTIVAAVLAGLLLWRTALPRRLGGRPVDRRPVGGREVPAAVWSAAVGLAVAGALASKATTLGLVPLALAAIAGGTGRAPEPHARVAARMAVRLAVCGGAMFVGLWAIYGFTIGPASLRSTGVPYLAPFPEWLVGLSGQLVHGFGEGHANYLFGWIGSNGWWWFYLACIAVKTTLGVQALALLRGIALVRRPPAASSVWVDLALLSCPALLFVVMSASKHQGGSAFSCRPSRSFCCGWGASGATRSGPSAASGLRSVCCSSRRARPKCWHVTRTI